MNKNFFMYKNDATKIVLKVRLLNKRKRYFKNTFTNSKTIKNPYKHISANA